MAGETQQPTRAVVAPPSRAMADRDRYRPPAADERVEVLVDDVRHPGEVLGRNGARVHVVFVKDGSRYRRWVDADDVLVL